MVAERSRQSEYTPPAGGLLELYTQAQAICSLSSGRLRHKFFRQEIEPGFRKTKNFGLYGLADSPFSRIKLYTSADIDSESQMKLLPDMEKVNILVEMWTPKSFLSLPEQVFVGLIKEGEDGNERIRAVELPIEERSTRQISERNFKALKDAAQYVHDKVRKQQPIHDFSSAVSIPYSDQLRS